MSTIVKASSRKEMYALASEMFEAAMMEPKLHQALERMVEDIEDRHELARAGWIVGAMYATFQMSQGNLGTFEAGRG